MRTEEEVCELAETDIHAALVEPNAPIGLLMNHVYHCLETIQKNPTFPLFLLENVEFASMVGFVRDSRRRLLGIPVDRCKTCRQLELL